MIEVDSLTKSFGPFQAVKGISFKIGTGEVVGLLGPNGAGKTTTMRMLTGYYRPTSGSVQIGGQAVQEDAQAVQKMIGYLPESASSNSDMVVLDFLTFIGKAHGLSPEKIRFGLDHAIEATALQKYIYRPISHLSKGYRQRVGLAATLVHDPQILILDEPTSGLDPNQLVEIRELIRNLAKSKTIIFSTHILQEVEATCTRVMVISDGLIVHDDSLEHTLQKGSLESVFQELTLKKEPK